MFGVIFLILRLTVYVFVHLLLSRPSKIIHLIYDVIPAVLVHRKKKGEKAEIRSDDVNIEAKVQR